MTHPRPPRLAVAIAVALAATIGLTACSAALAPSAVPTANVTPEPTPRPTPSPAPTPTPVPTPVPTPTPIPLDQGLLARRVTILIAGTDSNPDRRSRGLEVNTDAMIVASVDAARQQVAMVALPRDTVDLVMADGSSWPQKANAIMRNLGLDALKGALSATYGVPIDYYIAIDMPDFGALVEAVGGVDVENPFYLYDAGIGLDLAAGPQHLDGNNAARYVRTRRQDGDYGRAGRQQQVVEALARKLVDPASAIDPMALVGRLRSLQTDIPADKLPTLLEIARRSTGAQVSTQVLAPPRFALFAGDAGDGRGWVIVPNVAEMRAYVQAVMGY